MPLTASQHAARCADPEVRAQMDALDRMFADRRAQSLAASYAPGAADGVIAEIAARLQGFVPSPPAPLQVRRAVAESAMDLDGADLA